MMWAFTQSASDRMAPYFTSYHRRNRDVQNPEESTAKCVSTVLSGRAIRRGQRPGRPGTDRNLRSGRGEPAMTQHWLWQTNLASTSFRIAAPAWPARPAVVGW